MRRHLNSHTQEATGSEIATELNSIKRHLTTHRTQGTSLLEIKEEWIPENSSEEEVEDFLDNVDAGADDWTIENIKTESEDVTIRNVEQQFDLDQNDLEIDFDEPISDPLKDVGAGIAT